MATHFYTASSIDGFIATDQHSLDWLLKQDIDEEGPMSVSYTHLTLPTTPYV
mgnify:CR=1 FL=1